MTEQPIPGKIVEVIELPRCDFCGGEAEYDFATIYGPWANGCDNCYFKFRANSSLGVGMGQKLIVKPKLTHAERLDRAENG